MQPKKSGQPQTTIPVAVVIVNEKDHKTTMTVLNPDGSNAEQKAVSDAWKAAAQVAAEYHAAWLVPA